MRLMLVLAISARLAQAGNVKMWSADELATAEVVAAGRVDGVIRGPAAPEMRRHSGTDVRTCTATVHILRAFPAIDTPVIPLAYSCFGPVVRIRNGPFPPPIQKGKVFLLPLMRRRKQWRLIGEDGMQLVRAVLQEAPQTCAADSRREFIARELANVFIRGSYEDLLRAGRDLIWESSAELPVELMAQLHAGIPPGDPRWLDIATALVVEIHVPISGDLDEARASTPGRPCPPGEFTWRVVQEIPEPERRKTIAEGLIGHIHTSAGLLLSDFKPELLEWLPGGLERLQPGATVCAWELAQSGDRRLLPESLAAALRVLAMPEPPYDLISAAKLLISYGSEQQFGNYLQELMRARRSDQERYVSLWWPAQSLNGPRVLRILGVWLDDRRPAADQVVFFRMRYCDAAAERVRYLAGKAFGASPAGRDLASRNALVEKARGWVRDKLASL